MAGSKKPESAKPAAGKKAESAPKAAPAGRERYRLPTEGPWATAWKLFATLAVLGLIGCAVGYGNDPRRFAFAWLFAFMSVLAIGLGSLFLVIVQHLTGAGWSVSVRRTSEIFATGLFVIPLLFIPIATHMDALYPWMHQWREHVAGGALHDAEGHDAEGHEAGEGESHDEHSSAGESLIGASTAHAQEHGEEHAAAGHHGGGHDAHHTPEHAAHEATVVAKLAYLDQNFWWLRAVVLIGIWLGLTWFYFSNSTRQDTSRSLAETKRMQSFAPVSMFAFALSLTFAAFDWMMSLEPTWFSTIYGVQYFSVSVVSGLSILVLVSYGLRSAGVFGEAVSVEHYHDLGKLLFGFLVFWAYISFSQFMLIWYASIPEETTYYHLRWSEGWQTFSLFLAVGHFVVPFFLLMSRNVKRRLPVLAFGAALLLVMHVLECYWLVMPYFAQDGVLTTHLRVHWMDVAALFACGGTFLGVVFFVMGRYPLVPVGDPRLSQALHHEVH